eukprot:1192455-Prorocentrum_minimum.AAC.3
MPSMAVLSISETLKLNRAMQSQRWLVSELRVQISICVTNKLYPRVVGRGYCVVSKRISSLDRCALMPPWSPANGGVSQVRQCSFTPMAETANAHHRPQPNPAQLVGAPLPEQALLDPALVATQW